MSSVGSITTDIFRGVPPRLRLRVDTWEVAGLDGYGAQTLGNGHGDFNVQTVCYCDSDTSADDLIDQAAAIQGTVVSVVDDFGVTFNNILIQLVDADNPLAKMPVIKGGNPNAVRVTLNWRMITTA